MTGNEYQKLAMRTNDSKATERLISARENFCLENRCSESDSEIRNADFGGVLNACLGLSGEVGEFNDMIKKWIFHEKDLDEEHLKKELGDIMWYIAMMCHAFRWDLDEIMEMNVNKLKARYPEGFDTNRSNNRENGDV